MAMGAGTAFGSRSILATFAVTARMTAVRQAFRARLRPAWSAPAGPRGRAPGAPHPRFRPESLGHYSSRSIPAGAQSVQASRQEVLGNPPSRLRGNRIVGFALVE